MASPLPFPIELSKLVDGILAESGLSGSLTQTQVPMDYMPEVFDVCFSGYRNQSTSAARYAHADGLAEASGRQVFEYNLFPNRKQEYGFFGLTVARDEEELRNRLSVFIVMGS